MKLPVLITIPHGGTRAPFEARGCRLTAKQFAEDGDTWACRLYDFGDQVTRQFATAVPRAIVDLNRAIDDLAWTNPDGVVKRVTVDGTPVWPDPSGPSPELTHQLLERYYIPWHESVRRAATDPALQLAVDCHTMLAIGPKGHAMEGRSRPLICVGNRGDRRGNASGEPLTAPAELARAFLEQLSRQFAHEDVEIFPVDPSIRLNHPFAGGYIVRHHSAQGTLPWLQLEISRALYLPADFDTEPSSGQNNRLEDLKQKIFRAIRSTI